MQPSQAARLTACQSSAVGGERGLHRVARHDRAAENGLDLLQQRLAGLRDHAVLLLQARQRQRHVGTALREAGESGALARMVHRVAVLAQVGDDLADALVVRPLAAVEQVELSLKAPEQLVEVHMVGVPGGNCHGHRRGFDHGASPRGTVRVTSW